MLMINVHACVEVLLPDQGPVSRSVRTARRVVRSYVIVRNAMRVFYYCSA